MAILSGLLGGQQHAQSGLANQAGMLGCGTSASQQHAVYQNLVAQQAQIPPLRPQQYVEAALHGLMSREASYMFTYDEMAVEAWNLAESMAKEAQKRGY